MYSKRKRSLFRTLTFRLTIGYAALFGVLSLAAFLLVYTILTSNLRQRTDEDLLNTANEFKALFKGSGIEALKDEFQREAESNGIARVVFQLWSPQGEMIAASDLQAWEELDAIGLQRPGPSENGVRFRTVSLPGRRQNVRMICGQTAEGYAIQIGTTMLDNELLAEKYRETFGTALTVMLICGSLVGWFMARRAMSGVERVTRVASQTGESSLSRRVPLGNEGQEIDDLALAFNEMLERIQALIKELNDFTDNVAHDLRTPITRIRGIAETTLATEQGVDAYREAAAAVVEESDRVVEMIRAILEIAQTDSGVVELNKKPVDFRGIIEEARDLFLPVAEDKDIHLAAVVPQEPLVVLGDVARLQRVTANLLDNAIKYTPRGGRVTISARGTASCIVISVTDSGIGIEEKDLPRVFDRFFRADQSRSTPGSGLGLSLARAIVRAHGGEIAVSSRPSEGSRFFVSLPRRDP